MKYKKAFQVSAASFFLLFLALSLLVLFRVERLSDFDQTLTHWIRIPYPDWNPFQRFITTFGNATTVILVFALVAFWLWFKKKRKELYWFVFNFVLVAGIFNPLIKLLVMRDRPSLQHLVVETTYSYPSGHAATSMILYGTLIFLMPSLIKTKEWVWIIQVLLGVLIVSIGASRVYLGVHYPSDILGGYSLSLFWLCLSYPWYVQQRLPFIHSNRKRDY
ncbi:MULTISPECIES: phosphatase PAP2 family protein [unclassified Enterococcus]|uniref:phosphatase PAP2 family protein n=1 Tax=unclassified Enterococcus TaxID=2608891 RepID=UPI001A9B16FC|nr:phosphatase PAP2 family protein [Enterococcus sp. DIV1271a]MBO1298698.1 phosphatase PAP2 family protein [Enterococcus sp. DIV1271a]